MQSVQLLPFGFVQHDVLFTLSKFTPAGNTMKSLHRSLMTEFLFECFGFESVHGHGLFSTRFLKSVLVFVRIKSSHGQGFCSVKSLHKYFSIESLYRHGSISSQLWCSPTKSVMLWFFLGVNLLTFVLGMRRVKLGEIL
uniref:Uncharacterized protein n=1 Tax=Cacopsylla melanoneura TaxID=428564 RepID=A0A8D8ZDV9_9HEMI